MLHYSMCVLLEDAYIMAISFVVIEISTLMFEIVCSGENGQLVQNIRQILCAKWKIVVES